MKNEKLSELEFYLQAVKIPLRLACQTKSGWPVVLSLWFLYQDGVFYCATPKSARVISYLKKDPQCAFEIAADLPPYCGVRGQAIAKIDQSQGLEILAKLIDRYLGVIEDPFAQNLLAKGEDEVAIIIEPVNIFTWDFSKRMKNIAPVMLKKMGKICPGELADA
jgi:hypothetical protein